jgi:pimeloyl-ACP methyl ester carboxylesterase
LILMYRSNISTYNDKHGPYRESPARVQKRDFLLFLISATLTRQVYLPPQSMDKQSRVIGLWKGCCDRLGEIKNPTLIIAGADDVLVPARNADYLSAKIPKNQLFLVENSGHGLMFQDPEKFSEKMIDFLK